MQVMNFLDWVFVLPPELDEAFQHEVRKLGKGKAMPYLNVFERKAMKKGIETELLDAIATGLDLRFGPPGRELLDAVRKLEDLDRLRAFHRALLTAESIEELKRTLEES